ncbi:hypothetical protein D3C73_1513650 [compost metagenome]
MLLILSGWNPECNGRPFPSFAANLDPVTLTEIILNPVMDILNTDMRFVQRIAWLGNTISQVLQLLFTHTAAAVLDLNEHIVANDGGGNFQHSAAGLPF